MEGFPLIFGVVLTKQRRESRGSDLASLGQSTATPLASVLWLVQCHRGNLARTWREKNMGEAGHGVRVSPAERQMPQKRGSNTSGCVSEADVWVLREKRAPARVAGVNGRVQL